jgi:hypothetical protein
MWHMPQPYTLSLLYNIDNTVTGLLPAMENVNTSRIYEETLLE